MSILGHCKCKNIKVTWHVIDYSMSPRACQCDYCSSKNAAYVSKSGSKVEVKINDKSHHKIVTQGSQTAKFHECANCNDIVFVTAEIAGLVYGIINADILQNKFAFSAPQETDFSGQSQQQKLERWQKNWCCPVTINDI
ncbi:MAG: hypothetical protein KUG78_01735 [Kangiellaceae bacterium]|nr:hypothetical protein [Kangiellaceae bacterium]